MCRILALCWAGVRLNIVAAGTLPAGTAGQVQE